MKVSIIAAGYPPDVRGGGEFSTKYLAEALFDAGAQVDVLACGNERHDHTECGVDVHRIRSPNLYWSFKPETQKYKKLIWETAENRNPVANSVIRNFLGQTCPDILLTSTTENFGAECWRVPAQLGIKTVHILRSYYSFCRRRRHSRMIKTACPVAAVASSAPSAAARPASMSMASSG